jgi:hypothetical protein
MSLGRGKAFVRVDLVLIQDIHTNALPLQACLLFVTRVMFIPTDLLMLLIESNAPNIWNITSLRGETTDPVPSPCKGEG